MLPMHFTSPHVVSKHEETTMALSRQQFERYYDFFQLPESLSANALPPAAAAASASLSASPEQKLRERRTKRLLRKRESFQVSRRRRSDNELSRVRERDEQHTATDPKKSNGDNNDWFGSDQCISELLSRGRWRQSWWCSRRREETVPGISGQIVETSTDKIATSNGEWWLDRWSNNGLCPYSTRSHHERGTECDCMSLLALARFAMCNRTEKDTRVPEQRRSCVYLLQSVSLGTTLFCR